MECGCDDVEDVILRRFPGIRRPGKVRGRAEKGEAAEVEEEAASTAVVQEVPPERSKCTNRTRRDRLECLNTLLSLVDGLCNGHLQVRIREADRVQIGPYRR